MQSSASSTKSIANNETANQQLINLFWLDNVFVNVRIEAVAAWCVQPCWQLVSWVVNPLHSHLVATGHQWNWLHCYAASNIADTNAKKAHQHGWLNELPANRRIAEGDSTCAENGGTPSFKPAAATESGSNGTPCISNSSCKLRRLFQVSHVLTCHVRARQIVS